MVLFHPHIPRSGKDYVNAVLDTRWIGQGPKVEEFDELFRHNLDSHSCPASDDCL